METNKQTPNQSQPTTQTQNQSQQKKVVKAVKLVDKATYDKYTSLYFLKMSGAKLTEDAERELKALENEIKNCSGKMPIRTVRAAIRNEQVLMIEGIPLPEEYLQIIKTDKTPEYYLGK